jgi:hypothetical protein
MPEAWSPLIVAAVAAVLAFVLGLLRLSRDTKVQRNEDLRRRRVEAYAAFCAAAIEYRTAQTNRWHAYHALDGQLELDTEPPELAKDLRTSRGAAWSRYYEVLMICDDPSIVEAANDALQSAADMNRSLDRAEFARLGDLVHDQVARFAVMAGDAVHARKQSLATEPQQVPAGTAT